MAGQALHTTANDNFYPFPQTWRWRSHMNTARNSGFPRDKFLIKAPPPSKGNPSSFLTSVSPHAHTHPSSARPPYVHPGHLERMKETHVTAAVCRLTDTPTSRRSVSHSFHERDSPWRPRPRPGEDSTSTWRVLVRSLAHSLHTQQPRPPAEASDLLSNSGRG